MTRMTTIKLGDAAQTLADITGKSIMLVVLNSHEFGFAHEELSVLGNDALKQIYETGLALIELDLNPAVNPQELLENLSANAQAYTEGDDAELFNEYTIEIFEPRGDHPVATLRKHTTGDMTSKWIISKTGARYLEAA